jgi:hypothetical protein
LSCRNWLFTHVHIITIALEFKKPFPPCRVATRTESHWSNYRIWIVETPIKVSDTFVTQNPHPHRLPALLNVPLSLNKCWLEQDYRRWDI